MSFKPEFQIIDGGPRWYRNGLTFATKKEAEASALEFKARWDKVTATRAVEVKARVNSAWINGKLVELTE